MSTPDVDGRSARVSPVPLRRAVLKAGGALAGVTILGGCETATDITSQHPACG